MTHDEPDPVLTLVAGLRAPRPTEAFDERLRSRCHAAMARRIRARSPAALPLMQRVVDAALLGVVGSYAAIAVLQAADVASRVLGHR